MKMSKSFLKFGVPSPVTGSQPLTALNPGVLHPGFPPVVIWKMSVESLEKRRGTRETHVIEGMWMLVERGVQESHGALVGRQALLVDQGDDTRKDRS